MPMSLLSRDTGTKMFTAWPAISNPLATGLAGNEFNGSALG
jgi:hypothetical protein